MNWADIVNGIFEGLAGVFMVVNCRRVLIDKDVKGVSVIATAFFASWSVWNLYYYPSLGQWMSFAGGLIVGFGNMLYVLLLMKYKKRV